MKGVYKCVFSKRNKIFFVNYVINKIMKRCKFSVNNPYFNHVEIFDSEGDEIICFEDDIKETINYIEKGFLITMWRDDEAIDLIFNFSDDKYDVFELNFDGLKSNECLQIINDISIVVLKNRQHLIGIIVDKKGFLSEICFKYNDNLCLDFMFNLKSPIRKEVHKINEYNICLYDFPETCRQIDENNIYIFVFLNERQIMIEIFEYK